MMFSDRLVDAVRRAGAPVCVGLDPVLEKLPAAVRDGRDAAGAIAQFCRGVVRAVAPHMAAVKCQSACFERHGAAGVAALWEVQREAAGAGLAVVLDAKRGDIGISAGHYAAAARHSGAHAVTVSGYLGMETVEPFLKEGLGVFVLVRTSNPGSDAVQAARLGDGRTVGEMMADEVAALGATHLGQQGYSDVGAVVGATKSAEGRALRGRMPRQWFLVPGYGAQGGTAEDIRALLDGRPECGGGVLVTASRSVIYAFDAGDRAWEKAVTRAAIALAGEVAAVVG
ncbi:MAG: orotidine-5'-phosphate decarboxylase [Phycisphaerales bacterium]